MRTRNPRGSPSKRASTRRLVTPSPTHGQDSQPHASLSQNNKQKVTKKRHEGSFVVIKTCIGGKWRDTVTVPSCGDVEEKEFAIPGTTGGKVKIEHDEGGVVKVTVDCPKGGQLVAFRDLEDRSTCAKVAQECCEKGQFRSEKIQCNLEPRAHFLVHSDATDDPNPDAEQPYYGYAKKILKAVPASRFPLLSEFTGGLEKRYASETDNAGFNIGNHVVLYRCGRDYMGRHKDDDQGEKFVLVVVLESPETPRPLILSPDRKHKEGDIKVYLYPNVGSAYSMDGTLQVNYFHQVPQDPATFEKAEGRRLAVVLRQGVKRVTCKRNTGIEVDQKPRKARRPSHGRPVCTEEGAVHGKTQMMELGIHNNLQQGVSGNKDDGADAITVSQNLLDESFQDPNDEFDNFSKFVYEANNRHGGLALARSYDLRLPVRVFRSSHLEGPLRAIGGRRTKTQQQFYRYDGLYHVIDCEDGVCYDRRFFLQRAEAGRCTKTKNARSAEEHISFCRIVKGTLVGGSKKRKRVETTHFTVSK